MIWIRAPRSCRIAKAAPRFLAAPAFRIGLRSCPRWLLASGIEETALLLLLPRRLDSEISKQDCYTINPSTRKPGAATQGLRTAYVSRGPRCCQRTYHLTKGPTAVSPAITHSDLVPCTKEHYSYKPTTHHAVRRV